MFYRIFQWNKNMSAEYRYTFSKLRTNNLVLNVVKCPRRFFSHRYQNDYKDFFFSDPFQRLGIELFFNEGSAKTKTLTLMDKTLLSNVQQIQLAPEGLQISRNGGRENILVMSSFNKLEARNNALPITNLQSIIFSGVMSWQC